MRSRPYLSASEPPRPYSEIVAERRRADPTHRILDDIAEMEAEAAAMTDPVERKRRQCEAEELRCQLAHRPPAEEF